MIEQLVRFSGGREKAAYIDGSARLEQNQRAVRVACAPFVRFADMAQRAEMLHAWVRDNIRYVRDYNGDEELADSATILERRFDDCDGKARLFLAMALALGFDGRIRPVYRRKVFKHVQAEIRWPGSIAYRNADMDGWVPVELILEGVPLGCGTERALRDASGAPRTR